MKSENGGHTETIKSADRVRGMVLDCPTGLTCLNWIDLPQKNL
jgi:hypothetical protein